MVDLNRMDQDQDNRLLVQLMEHHQAHRLRVTPKQLLTIPVLQARQMYLLLAVGFRLALLWVMYQQASRGRFISIPLTPLGSMVFRIEMSTRSNYYFFFQAGFIP